MKELSPAIDAIERGDQATVARLLDGGLDPNEWLVADFRTPLLLAIEHSQQGVVELLLRRGADPNRSTPTGVTPIQLFIDSALEDAKAEFDDTGEMIRPSVDIVRCLLDSGADPHQLDGKGRSALDWARLTGHSEAEELLRHWRRGDPFRGPAQ